MRIEIEREIFKDMNLSFNYCRRCCYRCCCINKIVLVCYVLFLIVIPLGLINAQEDEYTPKLEINFQDLIESYTEDEYVIDLRKEGFKREPIFLKCSTGPNAIDLNLTFTGLEPKNIRVGLFISLL